MNSVERFDPSSKLWVCSPPMLELRFRHGVATIRNRLYVSGGFGENTVLYSVERFDPEVGCWERLRPMSFSRASHAVVAFYGNLFVLGGATYEDDTETAPAECYDASHGVWTARVDMLCERACVGAGVLLLARASSHRDEMCDRGPSPRRRRLNSSLERRPRSVSP